MTKMNLETIFVGNNLRNFSYLIPAGENRYYCVDPYDANGIVDRLKRLGGELIGIINTHQHHDHICGNDQLITTTNIPLFAHENAYYERSFTRLKNGDRISLEGENALVFCDTPGHTMTHLSIFLEYKGQIWGILTGDTLFNAGVGHCKLGGHPEILFETIQEKFKKLDEKIEIFPGHEYFGNNLKFSLHCEPENKASAQLLKQVEKINWNVENFRTTMDLENKINPFLRLDSISLRKNLNLMDKTDKEVFLILREMRNQW